MEKDVKLVESRFVFHSNGSFAAEVLIRFDPDLLQGFESIFSRRNFINLDEIKSCILSFDEDGDDFEA